MRSRNPNGWEGLLVIGVIGAGLVLLLPRPVALASEDGDAIVIVNGQPIPRKKVVDMLLETHGLAIMQQLVALELAKQETQRRGLTVTDADVQEQFRRAVNEIAPERDAAGVTLSEPDKRVALEKVLRDRGLTMPEFMVAMERNAHLRKGVEQDFQVDEPTLREEFARTYGERVEVRHIQVNAGDSAGLHQALDLLQRGTDFAEVARRLSVNRETGERGGLMAPFAFSDQTIPAALREVAFSLAPGERSGAVVVGEMVHVLKLERRIPPADARFEDVRAEVARKMRERVVAQRMNELMTRIFDQAKIRVLDRQLKKEFDELMKQRGSPERTP